MSQSDPGDARDDQTGRFGAPGAVPPVRPLSPHLQVWRFHVTMTASILHRITGAALAGGAVLVLLWLAALACGPEGYALFTGVMASPIGLLIWFGVTVALLYHWASGIRHLVWDTGRGFALPAANAMAWASILFAVVGAVAFWAWLFMSGRVSL